MYPEYENERVSTTFWQDFSIAEKFGIDAVKDTYKRAFAEWKNSYKYLTELVMVLNHKCWQQFDLGNTRLSGIYGEMYYAANDWAYASLTGDELDFYFHVTD